MYDPSKIEDAVLALLGVFEFEEGRVWKKYDFEVMDALFAKGYITNPIEKPHSVNLTPEGFTKAKEYADKLFHAGNI